MHGGRCGGHRAKRPASVERPQRTHRCRARTGASDPRGACAASPPASWRRPGSAGRTCDRAVARSLLFGVALAPSGHRSEHDLRHHAVNRRAYLDWLRGIAVLIMIEAHTLDSWTRVADRARGAYKWAIVVGGFGAPFFLFLAGIALALAAG